MYRILSLASCITLGSMLSSVLLAHTQPGRVLWHQKISDTHGGFRGLLDNGDRLGGSVALLGDLDGDEVADIAVVARGDDDGGTNHGAVWVLFLERDGTVRSHQKISDTQIGFGGSIASLGDLDGDGVEDLAVGAPGDDDGSRGPCDIVPSCSRGAVWILFLNTDGTVKSEQKISGTQGGFMGTLENWDSFGFSVASLGDLNGDGIAELAVGATGDDDGGSGHGAVWVLFLDGIPADCNGNDCEPTPCPLSTCEEDVATLTQSFSMDIILGSGVACGDGLYTSANAWARCFDLATEGIAGDLTVESVDFGFETAPPDGVDVPIFVNLYLTALGCPATGLGTPDTTLLATTETVMTSAHAGVLLNVVFAPPVLVPAGSTLIVEFGNLLNGFDPKNGVGTFGLWPGANPDGQCRATSFRPGACELFDWVTLAAVGLPDSHVVMQVHGTCDSIDPCADDDGDGQVTICHIPPGNPNNERTITVSVNALPAHLAHGDQCGPCVE